MSGFVGDAYVVREFQSTHFVYYYESVNVSLVVSPIYTEPETQPRIRTLKCTLIRRARNTGTTTRQRFSRSFVKVMVFLSHFVGWTS